MKSFRLRLGPNFTEGARQVWLMMAARGLSQADVIRRLSEDGGSSARGLLSKWLYGDQLPGVGWAARIERAFSVPSRLWAERAHRAFVPPARALALAELAAYEDDAREPGP